MKNVCEGVFSIGNMYHLNNRRKKHVSEGGLEMSTHHVSHTRLFFCAVESSESESSEDEEGQDDAMGKITAGAEDIHNEAFWELDLNPDLPS
jgi:hypothetical protein